MKQQIGKGLPDMYSKQRNSPFLTSHFTLRFSLYPTPQLIECQFTQTTPSGNAREVQPTRRSLGARRLLERRACDVRVDR